MKVSGEVIRRRRRRRGRRESQRYERLPYWPAGPALYVEGHLDSVLVCAQYGDSHVLIGR